MFFCFVCFFSIGVVVFSLFVSWFRFVPLMCFLVSLVIFCNCCYWEGGVSTEFLLSFFFLLFFSRGKGYLNFLVGRERDSCSAGQSMTYISFLEAYNSFVGEWEDLDASKKSFIIVYIFNIFFTNYF